jgi:hypothetical protein
MFQQTPGGGSSGSFSSDMKEAANSVRLADLGLKSIKERLRQGFGPFNIIDQVADLNQQTADAVRSSLGQGREITQMMQENFANATQRTLEFGIGQKENLDLFRSINDQLQRNTILTSEQIFNLNILAKNAGITQEAMAKIVEGFDTIGVGITQALGDVSEIEKMSRNYGLNVNDLLSTVGDKLSRINAYGFQNGVRGFSQMAAKAQMLRMDMDDTLQLSTDLLDPNRAIEFSTTLQQLGVSAGGLNDAFNVMYLAQNDVEGLQDATQELLASFVSFDEITGDFTISAQNRRRLQELAPELGKSFEEAANEATRSAQRVQKLNFLEGISEISEEDKQFLANIGQFNGGRLEFTLGDTTKSIEDIMMMDAEDRSNYFDALESQRIDDAKEPLDVAKEQLGVLESIDAALRSQLFRPTAAAINNDEIMTGFEDMAGAYRDAIVNIGNTTTEFIDGSLEDLLNTGFSLIREGITSGINSELMNTAFDNFEIYLGEASSELGIFTDALEDATNGVYERFDVPVYERQSEVPTPMAEGGLVTEAVNAIVGEAGPEAIIPLDRLESMMAQTSVGPQSVSVNLNVSGKIPLEVDNVVTNFNIDTQKLGKALLNDPNMMAGIVSLVSGDERQYGMGILNPRVDMT